MLKNMLLLLTAACAQLGLSAPVAHAFPDKPVRIIVPQTPGGASDALARIMAQKLSEKWGQPVIVDNRPGAGGNIGMGAVVASAADGHVLLMTYVGTQAINGALYRNLPFDPVADFAPVATLATLPFVIVGRSNAPFHTVAELVGTAKNGRVTYGSAGNGSVNHLLGEMFSAGAKVKLEHVPYRGAAQALQDLLAGQIDVVFTSLPSVAGQLKSGNLRPIAVTSARRAKAFAQIPTVAEAGLPDFDVAPWFGLMAPGRVSREVIMKINTDVNDLLRSREVSASFEAQGAEPFPTSPDEFGQQLRADALRWGKVVRTSGARLD
ncbi:Bug family tripartite tricarboxylate transporter substrate binding protein [Comamonas sp.]|uniref:Bug family tripartite tricarboxylate transporter substrate binding protein n=1 Tax=Comamonas sp. TaxID=34028 RepID=UPI003A8DD4D8